MGDNDVYGCCPVGDICTGNGGSQFIDEKIGGSDTGDGGGSPSGDSNGASRSGKVGGGLLVAVGAGMLSML